MLRTRGTAIARGLRRPSGHTPPSTGDRVLACLRKVNVARDELQSGRGLSTHEDSVARLTTVVGEGLGLPSAHLERLRRAATVHDIGKIAIPDEAVMHNGPLAPSGLQLMRSHTSIGWSILMNPDDPLLTMAALIALEHHEAHDGSGYPRGLKNGQISLEARIVSICDVYDALRATRPYKPARSHEEALAIITRGDHRTSPTQFDPDVLRVFLDRQKEVETEWETAHAADVADSIKNSGRAG